MFRGNPIKDNVKRSSAPLKIPVSGENTDSFTSFSIMATINHSGKLQAGHYWSLKRDRHPKKWLKCNDTSVTPVQQKSLANEICYVLFYSNAQQINNFHK